MSTKPSEKRIFTPWHAASNPNKRCGIREGDVLLWRPASLQGEEIARLTDSAYSHAAMAGRIGGKLAALEMVQFAGGRVQPLQRQLARWPRRCDVYRPHGGETQTNGGKRKSPLARFPYAVSVLDEEPVYAGRAVVGAMFDLVGQDYGWLDMLYILAHRVLKFDPRKIPNSDDPNVPRVCSVAVAYAIRVGSGIEVWPSKCDAEIVPGDLGHADFSEYICSPLA